MNSPTDTPTFHPAVYIIVWILLSSSVILFNKYILSNLGFPFPILLTTLHMIFSAIACRFLKMSTRLLDDLQTIKMDFNTWKTNILPIGFLFSISLACSNLAYLSLSVSFIQMLKATTPVVVLAFSSLLLQKIPTWQKVVNVSLISFGVILATVGELRFTLIGFVFQAAGILAEGCRLVLVENLMRSSGLKLTPLSSLYFFAPVCAVFNFIGFLLFEMSTFEMAFLDKVGIFTILLNCLVAFGLNVSLVLLIGKSSSLVLTLSGVLKDVMLIVASVLLFHSPVTALQVFGYSLALFGLAVYKLDPDFKWFLGQYSDISIGLRSSGSKRKKVLGFLIFLLGLVVVTAFIPFFSTSSNPVEDQIQSILPSEEITIKPDPPEWNDRKGEPFKPKIVVTPAPERVYVLSRNKENLDGYDNIIKNVIVINKGDDDLGGKYNVSKIFKIDNVGRESHSYLWYIVQNYHNLPHVVVFSKAHFFNHKYIGQFEGADTEEKYLIIMGDSALQNGVSTNHKFDQGLQRFLSYTWNVQSKQDTFLPLSTYRNKEIIYFGDWFRSMFNFYPVTGFRVYWGGEFAVRRDHILKRPLEFYEKLLHELDYNSDPITGHFFERSWYYIFNPHIDE